MSIASLLLKPAVDSRTGYLLNKMHDHIGREQNPCDRIVNVVRHTLLLPFLALATAIDLSRWTFATLTSDILKRRGWMHLADLISVISPLLFALVIPFGKIPSVAHDRSFLAVNAAGAYQRRAAEEGVIKKMIDAGELHSSNVHTILCDIAQNQDISGLEAIYQAFKTIRFADAEGKTIVDYYFTNLTCVPPALANTPQLVAIAESEIPYVENRLKFFKKMVQLADKDMLLAYFLPYPIEWTPFAYIVKNKMLRHMAILFKQLNPNQIDARGMTPLAYAFLHNDMPTARFLIELGAIPNEAHLNQLEPILNLDPANYGNIDALIVNNFELASKQRNPFVTALFNARPSKISRFSRPEQLIRLPNNGILLRATVEGCQAFYGAKDQLIEFRKDFRARKAAELIARYGFRKPKVAHSQPIGKLTKNAAESIVRFLV